MAKFKVGDKVRVRNDLCCEKRYTGNDELSVVTINSPSILNIFAGTVRIIEGYTDFGNYLLNGSSQAWSDSMLEPVIFTKADLKDGMVVEVKVNRVNKRFMVLGDKLLNHHEFMRLDAFNDDLTHKASDLLTIAKVYISTADTLGSYFKTGYLKLFWERPKEEPVKEMTIEEIEKLVGCKVKVVGSEGK